MVTIVQFYFTIIILTLFTHNKTYVSLKIFKAICKNKMSVPSKENKPSKLLSVEENRLVFSLLGKKRLSQCTAVAEVFMADPPHFSKWNRFGMGVLCFIKDSMKRSYFMRLYCLRRKQTIWEQEIYDELAFLQPRPYLIIFEGQPSIVCINFASDAEAEKFAMLLQKYVLNRQKKVTSVRPAASTYVDQSIVKEIPDVIIGQKHKVQKKRGLKKADIGAPTNFVHLESGSRDIRLRKFLEETTGGNDGRDKQLSKFLEEAGVTPRMLNNRKTRDAVQSFIQDNQVLEKIQGDSTIFNRPAPQAPLSPPIPPRPSSKNDIVNQVRSASAPPPPPPPSINFSEMFDIQLPPIGEYESVANASHQPDLLSEIQKGFQLKPVDPQPQKSGHSDGRCNLLQDIQRGVTLKAPKARREDSPRPKDETHDLAKAMHEALNVILNANQNSSDEEVDDSFDNWDE